MCQRSQIRSEMSPFRLERSPFRSERSAIGSEWVTKYQTTDRINSFSDPITNLFDNTVANHSDPIAGLFDPISVNRLQTSPLTKKPASLDQ